MGSLYWELVVVVTLVMLVVVTMVVAVVVRMVVMVDASDGEWWW